MRSIYRGLGIVFLFLSLMAVQPATAATTAPIIVVQEHVALSGKYSIFDLGVMQPVTLSANVTLPSPSNENFTLTIQTFVTPKSASGTSETTKGTQLLRYSVSAPARVVEPWTFVFRIPANTTKASVTVTGTYTGSSILWKDQTKVAPVSVFGVYSGQSLQSRYTLIISEPDSSVVKKVVAQGFDYNATTYAGAQSIVRNGYYPGFVVILYQSALWDAVAWGMVGLGVVFLLVLPNSRVRERLPKSAPSFAKLTRPLRRVWTLVCRMDSHKFLSIYIIVSVLMLSLSFMAGPDPRVKVYVLGSGDSTTKIKDTLQQNLGNVQILTPSDTVSEFNTMATLGTVQVVVISDYNKLDVPAIQRYVINSLDLVPLIIVLGNANPRLANYTDRLYNGSPVGLGNPLVYAATPQDLGTPEIRADILRILRPNPVGLNLGVRSFELVAATVGLLSFFLVTFGMAFLVSRLIEIGGKPLMSSLVEGIFYSGGVFFFTQAIYMSSSALLAWPLGLHAVTSGSVQLTVLGLFHLGAGNQPRTLAAVLGFVVAAAPALWSRIDRYVVIAVGALAFFIVADPLTGGTVFFEFVLLLTGGPQLGFANTAVISLKSFLNQIGTDVAGWVSNNFGISSGEIFYYLGAVPLALVAKLKRSTATLALLVCGFAACDGIVRVAEMTAYKTGPSMVAGVLSGLVIAIAFLGISRVEGFVRHYFPSRR